MIMAANNTGRVRDANVGTSAPFSLYAGEDGNGDRSVDALLHAQANEVSALFFSQRNVDALQEGIRYRVYAESGGRFVIGRQSDVELGIVMRSYYLQHGRDRPGAGAGAGGGGRNNNRGPLEEVRRLNAMVLDFCVPRVLQEADSYIQYRKDAATLPMPMPRGEIATSKGTKTLEMKRFM